MAKTLIKMLYSFQVGEGDDFKNGSLSLIDAYLISCL